MREENWKKKNVAPTIKHGVILTTTEGAQVMFVCLVEALGATISPAEGQRAVGSHGTLTLLRQLKAVGLLVVQGWRCFSARGRP